MPYYIPPYPFENMSIKDRQNLLRHKLSYHDVDEVCEMLIDRNVKVMTWSGFCANGDNIITGVRLANFLTDFQQDMGLINGFLFENSKDFYLWKKDILDKNLEVLHDALINLPSDAFQEIMYSGGFMTPDCTNGDEIFLTKAFIDFTARVLTEKELTAIANFDSALHHRTWLADIKFARRISENGGINSEIKSEIIQFWEESIESIEYLSDVEEMEKLFKNSYQNRVLNEHRGLIGMATNTISFFQHDTSSKAKVDILFAGKKQELNARDEPNPRI